ncbi:MAG: hypothetical protein Q9M39_02920 [Sulfurovum sp.]|nr:hypothetical protein [Sulfurovum sp.]
MTGIEFASGSDIKNIKFLFKSLDNLENIKDSFNSLFSSNSYEMNKVTLFEKDINFLEYVIEKGYNDRSFGVQKKINSFFSYLLCSGLGHFHTIPSKNKANKCLK